MNFKNIHIEYHYLDVPAPFCYTKTITIQPTATSLKLEYKLEYTDREDFTIEELEEEGFSGEDDESWKGEIHLNWLSPITSLLALPKGEKATSANESLVQVDNTPFQTYGQESNWDYFIQELTQAIYETATWEQVLTIRYCKKDQEKAPIQKLQISFAKRSAQSITDNKQVEINWDLIQQLLKVYYLQEFREGEHNKKIPNEVGTYTDPSDGLWYEINKSSSNLNATQKESLMSILEGIFKK
ncbi:hypothetical protein [uncultured Cytophaga sp.]|uniref:hypothetical protein n=1 Tax=uncultured Cytophaga sp. TaxID=160238 RepID=UPI0026379D53|nr:hypothetical protein [uncultured Cytophaga sp.]